MLLLKLTPVQPAGQRSSPVRCQSLVCFDGSYDFGETCYFVLYVENKSNAIRLVVSVSCPVHKQLTAETITLSKISYHARSHNRNKIAMNFLGFSRTSCSSVSRSIAT